MKVNDINVTKQERLEPRKYYSEEQLIELFGIGDKKTPVKQSDVTRVLQNIQMRKSGTHPVRFKDGEVVEIDPKLATRINNWMAQRDSSQSKEDEKMVSSWEGFQKIAKLLGIEKMLPKPKTAYAKSDSDIDRMIQLAGLGEGHYKLPDYDTDKYQERDGLEGPFPTKSGKVLYYDPKEGMYYDPDTDMFITYDEFRQYDGYNESIEEYDAKGMNKYGISAVHKDGKFYAFRNGKMVGGPFDTIEQLADFQKKSIENEDTQQELPLPVNYTFTKTDFLDNEAENMHTENAVELAMMFGTEEEQKRMNMIMTAHNTRGYILPDEQEERDALVRKYYPMLEDVVEADDPNKWPGDKEVKHDPNIDVTTGKPKKKTVMGFNVDSKQDKIDAKKGQIAMAKRNAPKSGLTTKDVPKLEKELADLMKEDDDQGFTDKQIKQAFGVLNDKRYHQGNYSGAVATIEKIAKGLSKHPSVANALKRANEDTNKQVKPVRYDPKQSMPSIMKYAYQPDVTRALRKAAGLSDDAPVYFDDADLVYGDKTVWQSCGVDNDCTFGDAVKAIKKIANEDINEFKIDKVQSTYDAIMKGIRNRGPAEESEVGDYIPSGMTGEEIRKLIDMLEPQGYDKEFLLKDLGPMMEEDDPAPTPKGNSVLDRLRLIVKDKQNAKVQLDDGHLTVDLYTASAITQVYDKVNDANKAKMEKMMNTKEGLVKLTNAVFGMLNKRKMGESETAIDPNKLHPGTFIYVYDKEYMIVSTNKDKTVVYANDAFTGKTVAIKVKDITDMEEVSDDEVQDYPAEGVIDENVINAYRQLVEKRLNESVTEATEEDEVKQILAKYNVTDAEDIDYGSPVYDELFDYYSNSGEMPYGVMKARDGMPDEWIYNRLQDLGLLEAKLTKAQIKKRDKIADKMPDADFKKRYGKDWEAVKYGAATNMVKDSVIKRTMEDTVQEGEQVTREEEQQLLKKVDEFKNKDQEIKDIEAKEKALQDIQMNKHTKDDPELQDELKKRKAELERLKKLAGV